MLGKYYTVTPVKHSSCHVTPYQSRDHACKTFAASSVLSRFLATPIRQPGLSFREILARQRNRGLNRNVHLVHASITVNMLLLLWKRSHKYVFNNCVARLKFMQRMSGHRMRTFILSLNCDRRTKTIIRDFKFRHEMAVI